MRLQQELYERGPMAFSSKRLRYEPDLFEQRSSLFLTPTSEIPVEFVGSGDLDVELTLPLPTLFEAQQIRGYRDTKLWVDLLQIATGKIRWTPIDRARVTIVRHTLREVGLHNLFPKAALDALKLGSYGRSDGRKLQYFGAIVDDDPHSIEFDFYQQIVDSRDQIGCRIIVADMGVDWEPPIGGQVHSTPVDI